MAGLPSLGVRVGGIVGKVGVYDTAANEPRLTGGFYSSEEFADSFSSREGVEVAWLMRGSGPSDFSPKDGDIVLVSDHATQDGVLTAEDFQKSTEELFKLTRRLGSDGRIPGELLSRFGFMGLMVQQLAEGQYAFFGEGTQPNRHGPTWVAPQSVPAHANRPAGVENTRQVLSFIRHLDDREMERIGIAPDKPHLRGFVDNLREKPEDLARHVDKPDSLRDGRGDYGSDKRG